jgi:zinc and cadmium transporter
VALWAFASALVVSAASLVGIALLPLRDGRAAAIIPLLVALAAGALLGDALFHMLPEAFAVSARLAEPVLSLSAGIVGFSALDAWIRSWPRRAGVHSVGYVNLAADAIHNLVDGVAIAVSYAVSVEVGLATTVAVLAHEVPAELGDYGILLHAGFSPRRALVLNLLCSVTAIVGVALALGLGLVTGFFAGLSLPFTAGAFIYISVVHLLPEILRRRRPRELAILGASFAAMYVLGS